MSEELIIYNAPQMINLNNWDMLHRLLQPMMESGMCAISFLICFNNKSLNTTKVAIAVMLTKCPTLATRQERLEWEGKSQREFVVRVLGREVLAPPCASWLTRHPERDPLPPLLLLLLLPTTTMS